MKRKLLSLVLLVFILFVTQNFVLAVPKVVLDNKNLSFDVPPIIENGRTLVPLRTIFENLGAKVEWEPTSKTVTATKDNIIIKLTINSTNAYKNNQLIKIDTPPKIINGRTLVPLRFVSEAMGAYVGWDGNTETIHIFKTQPKWIIVTRVIDGDTVELENGIKVRLIGIDTPESTIEQEPYGKESSNYTKNLLEGKKVWLEYDVTTTDKYGRTLAYVYTETGTFVNALLVAEGYAQVMTIPPNVKYQEVFLNLEQKARNANKGLWGVKSDDNNSNNSDTKTSGIFVGSIQSNKYHYPDCKWAKKITSENEIWFKDAADAIAHNYEPCGVCNPPSN